MIGVSSLVRFWQEFRSQLAVERLKALVPTTATVSRIPCAADDARALGDAVLCLAYLNSTYQAGVQNLIDRAILEHWQQEHAHQVLPRYHKLDELPFDAARRRLSVIIQQESEPPLLICKGALEEMLQVCSWVEGQGELLPLTEVLQARIERLVAELGHDGFRVIAVAYKRLSYLHMQYALDDEQDLVLAGYIGLLDPPSLRHARPLKL